MSVQAEAGVYLLRRPDPPPPRSGFCEVLAGSGLRAETRRRSTSLPGEVDRAFGDRVPSWRISVEIARWFLLSSRLKRLSAGFGRRGEAPAVASMWIRSGKDDMHGFVPGR